MNFKNLDTKNDTVMIGGRYILKEKIGGGSFGQIYVASNRDSENIVAIKIERRVPNTYLTLSRESRVLCELSSEFGFPQLYHYGKEDQYNYIAISLLGQNLEKLFKVCNKKFSLKTVLMLTDQILTRIEVMHSKNFLHRDIKPENYCMGLGNQSHNLFMIDFGLARSFRDSRGKHINYKENKGLVGTARYASLNAHLGIEQSRRDDLESIGYTLIYLLKGKLPWMNVKATNKHEKYQQITELKMKTPIEMLCKDLPNEFCMYLNYVKSLGFTDQPNYKYMKKLFRTLFVRCGLDYDYNYDWLISRKRSSNMQRSKNFLDVDSNENGNLVTGSSKKIANSSTKNDNLNYLAVPSKLKMEGHPADSRFAEARLSETRLNNYNPALDSRKQAQNMKANTPSHRGNKEKVTATPSKMLPVPEINIMANRTAEVAGTLDDLDRLKVESNSQLLHPKYQTLNLIDEKGRFRTLLKGENMREVSSKESITESMGSSKYMNLSAVETKFNASSTMRNNCESIQYIDPFVNVDEEIPTEAYSRREMNKKAQGLKPPKLMMNLLSKKELLEVMSRSTKNSSAPSDKKGKQESKCSEIIEKKASNKGLEKKTSNRLMVPSRQHSSMELTKTEKILVEKRAKSKNEYDENEENIDAADIYEWKNGRPIYVLMMNKKFVV